MTPMTKTQRAQPNTVTGIAQTGAALADPPAGKRTSKGVVTTVTLPDGAVAKRTSQRGNYTHAVVLSAEDPDLVRKVRTARVAELEERVALIDATLAQEKPTLKIRSRGLHRHGQDPDVGYQGKPNFHGFETMLYAADGKTVLEFTHSNSKAIVQGVYDYEAGRYDGEATQPARQSLLAKARSTRERLAKDLEDERKALADLDAGTYDFGEPKVVRWSSRRDLAEKAARSDFPNSGLMRHAYVVPVDGYEG